MKEKAIKLIDGYVGTVLIVLFCLIGLLRKKTKKTGRILVIMFWGIGSNITALPALKALRKKFPDARITVLAPEKNKALFFKNKNIDELIFVDLGIFNIISLSQRIMNKFDIVIDTEHFLNVSAVLSFFAGRRRIGFSNRMRAMLYTDKVPFDPSKHSVENNLSLARIAGADLNAGLERIETNDSDKKFADEFLMEDGIKKSQLVVGVCPGSGPTMKERRWPKEKFAELCDRLIEKHNAKIILIGSKDESSLINEVAGIMKNKAASTAGFSLGQVIALIDSCYIVISNDTGPMHIAAAQGIKTIGLFGPETPVIFSPMGKGNVSFFKGIECSPCIRIYEGRHIKCINEQKCMKLISVQEVLMAAERLIA